MIKMCSQSMIAKISSLALFATAAIAAPAGGWTGAAYDPETFYRQSAIVDVEAAVTLIEENHPGAAPDVKDARFLRDLTSATELARQRAKRVDTPEAYLAVMSGMTNMLGDRHLSFKPAISITTPRWAGLIVGYKEGAWVVVDEDNWPGRPELKGAELTGCEGRPASDIARERLGGFRADWSIPAQRALAAPWLLIDERNPFLSPLETCTFRTSKGVQTISMSWRPVSRDSIIARINQAAGIGSAGYGVRRTGDGWWISIGEFTDKAPAVIDKARSLKDQLRSAPFIIFDVRGNGGGASDLGDQLAKIIYGDDVFPSSAQCPQAWRVSPDNLARLESYPRLFGDRLSPAVLEAIASEIKAMRQAAAAGEAFSRPLQPCREKAVVPRTAPRVLLLTDRVCFSSCLLVVQTFRALGAIQIGEPTNGNTHYQENRRETLPSGLGTIGVQATVDLSQPLQIGPFNPEIYYPGDLTDTKAVQNWILANERSWALPRETARP